MSDGEVGVDAEETDGSAVNARRSQSEVGIEEGWEGAESGEREKGERAVRTSTA